MFDWQLSDDRIRRLLNMQWNFGLILNSVIKVGEILQRKGIPTIAFFRGMQFMYTAFNGFVEILKWVSQPQMVFHSMFI